MNKSLQGCGIGEKVKNLHDIVEKLGSLPFLECPVYTCSFIIIIIVIIFT